MAYGARLLLGLVVAALVMGVARVVIEPNASIAPIVTPIPSQVGAARDHAPAERQRPVRRWLDGRRAVPVAADPPRLDEPDAAVRNAPVQVRSQRRPARRARRPDRPLWQHRAEHRATRALGSADRS